MSRSRRNLTRRKFSHELHASTMVPNRPRASPPPLVARSPQPPLERLLAPSSRACGRHRRDHPNDSILRLFPALCVARESSPAAGSPPFDPDHPPTQPITTKTVLT